MDICHPNVQRIDLRLAAPRLRSLIDRFSLGRQRRLCNPSRAHISSRYAPCERYRVVGASKAQTDQDKARTDQQQARADTDNKLLEEAASSPENAER